MSADIELLTRAVERVSLGCKSQEKPPRNESFTDDIEDKETPHDNWDVDMSESPSALAAPKETQEESTADESSSYPQNEIRNESFENDQSTNSSETSPLYLRRSGKSSLGLGKDFCEIFYAALASLAYLAISSRLSNSSTFTKVLRDIGRLSLVCVSLFQVIPIFRLLRDLFRIGWTNRTAGKIIAPSRRRGASRTHRRGGRWSLSAADKVDNCACKAFVLSSLIVTRICVILLCNLYLGFVTVDYESLIGMGYENLNDMMSFVDRVSYGEIFNNPDLHANVLRECKTVPELVFENRYMCT